MAQCPGRASPRWIPPLPRVDCRTAAPSQRLEPRTRSAGTDRPARRWGRCARQRRVVRSRDNRLRALCRGVGAPSVVAGGMTLQVVDAAAARAAVAGCWLDDADETQ